MPRVTETCHADTHLQYITNGQSDSTCGPTVDPQLGGPVGKVRPRPRRALLPNAGCGSRRAEDSGVPSLRGWGSKVTVCLWMWVSTLVFFYTPNSPGTFCFFTVFKNEGVVAPRLRSSCAQKTHRQCQSVCVQPLPRRCLGRGPLSFIKTHSTKKTSTD